MRLIVLFILLVVFSSTQVQAEISLVPKPQHLVEKGAVLTLDAGLRLKNNPKLLPTANYLNALIVEWNGLVQSKKGKGGALPVVLKLGKVADGNPEAYSLSVSKSKIVIKGNSQAGCFYGVQTLKQLIKADQGQLTIPQVEIVDYPNLAWRSYMLDESRHFFGKEFVKKLLDELAALKINTFHWHLTDDAGWRIEIKKYPKLTEVGAFRNDTQVGGFKSDKLAGVPHGGFYTQEEIKEIIDYAAARHIQIIPEIEMPGHASAAIASYPWLGIIGELTEVPYRFGKLKDSYNISNPEVITFLHDVLDEVCELFPSDVIHIGGDEVLFGTWSASEDMKKYMKDNKLNSPAEAQVKFTNDISNYLESKGKRMMGWNEIMGKNVHNFENVEDYKAGTTALSKKTIIHFWRGDVELITEAAQNGYEIVNSLHSHTYLDYGYKMSPVKHMYNFSPIPKGLEKQYEKNIIGVGTQMWNEWNPTYQDVEYKTFPRIAAIAEVVWSGAGEYDSFVKRLKEYSKNWIEQGINFPVEEIK